eukprot:10772619-Alexandrium_andersonii.AAC.1
MGRPCGPRCRSARTPTHVCACSAKAVARAETANSRETWPRATATKRHNSPAAPPWASASCRATQGFGPPAVSGARSRAA